MKSCLSLTRVQDRPVELPGVKAGWILLGCTSASSTFRLKTFTASLREELGLQIHSLHGCRCLLKLVFTGISGFRKSKQDY